MSNAARVRAVWWTLHRWIGVGLAVLLVPISVSGALLVWHDDLDALINPGRYAVTRRAVRSRRRSCWRVRARRSPRRASRPRSVSRNPGSPATVTARGAPRAESVAAAPRQRLSRPADRARAGHGRFPLVAVRLAASLPREPDDPGIFRPRRRRLGRRRDADPVAHRHLAVVAAQRRVHAAACAGAAPPQPRTTCIICSDSGSQSRSPWYRSTGIYLGFPQQARELLVVGRADEPAARRPASASIARDTQLTPTRADAARRRSRRAAVVVFLPSQATAASAPARGERQAPASGAQALRSGASSCAERDGDARL